MNSQTIKQPETDHYFTIGGTAIAEFKDRGSKFLAYAFPITDPKHFKSNLQTVKKEHPKATHYCFAYRIGNDGAHFRVSDAGEPSGTAGRQILGQIDSKGLINILIIVVRYFGGTLLGVQGLIKAYKTVSALVLQCTPIVRKTVKISYQLQFNYTEINDVMQVLKQYDCTILTNEMQLFCKMEADIPINSIDDVLAALNEIKNTIVLKPA